MVPLTIFEKMLINKIRMTDHVSCATHWYICSATCLEGVHTLLHLLYQRSEKLSSKIRLAGPWKTATIWVQQKI